MDRLVGNFNAGCRSTFRARLVQYRDKTSDDDLRLQQAQSLRALCRHHEALFIVNDDIALAKRCDADGVHIGKHDATFARARAELPSHVMIGVSCYDSLERALEAEAAGADYVAFGSFYPSQVKPNAVRATSELLRSARERLTVPICAIGGITVDNAPDLISDGAQMLAVISALFKVADPAAAARAFSELFEGTG